MNLVSVIRAWLGLGPATTAILLGIAACLVAGTALRGIAVLRWPGQRTWARWWSVLSWWALFVVLVAALALGRAAVAAALAVASILALREALRLTAEVARRARPALATWHAAGVAIAISVLGPSFAVAVASLPEPATAPAEPLGALVLLLLLTEINDIAQAWWGRALGSRRMAPRLSPNKTWEGLAGGVLTTVVVALLLAPRLTGYGTEAAGRLLPGPPWASSLALGLMVSLAGVGGDLSASWLKRRAGVKDAGRLLPGQGGMLDRIDSLSATAPTFFAVSWLLWGAGR